MTSTQLETSIHRIRSPDYLFLTRQSRLYQVFTIIIALAYGCVLASLPIEASKDGIAYLNYATSSPVILASYFAKGWISVVFNEPIWLFFNIGLSQLFTPNNVVRVMIFLSGALVAHSTLRLNKKYFLFILFALITPQMMKNHITHIRQGVAISLFMIGWSSKNRVLKAISWGITPFVHMSFSFVLFLERISHMLVRMRIGANLRIFVFVLLGLSTALNLGLIASSLAVRQVHDYEFGMTEVSGLGFIFWLFILLLMISQGRKFQRKNTFSISIISFYLSTYFLVEVTARIFESALLVVVLSCLNLTGRRFQLFILAFCFNTLVQYFLRWNQINLGF